MNPASEKLAKRILEKLVQERLLSQQEGRKILPKLAEGKIRSEDWRLAIEISMAQKKKP